MSDPDASNDGETADPPPETEGPPSVPPQGTKEGPPSGPGDGSNKPPPGGQAPPGGRRVRPVWFVPLLVAALLAIFGGRETWYVQQDQAFCAKSCHHEREPAGRTHEGHSNTPCQKCHTTRVSTGWSLLVDSWLTKSEHPKKHGKVEPVACEGCHSQENPQWTLIAQTQGHRDHRGAKNVNCLSCHGAPATGDKTIQGSCKGCHEDQRLHKPTTEGAETCLSCHSFAATPSEARQPTVLACEKCHAEAGSITKTSADGVVVPMKPVDEHVLHGGVACQLCHNAHGKKPRPPEGQPVCARCHQITTFSAGKQVKAPIEGHQNCEQCHKPHLPVQTANESCRNCHQKNAGALLATVPTAPGSDAPSTALKHERCASCHLPHSWRAEPSGCKTCHADKAQMIQTRSPPQHGTCQGCHDVHGPPPTGAVCLTCHAKTKSKHVALAPGRHKDCTSCHNPHAPSPQDTRTACAKCHVQELAQASREGPAGHVKSRGCLNCHKPHENPLPPDNLCSQCHENKAVQVAVASASAHKVCTSCHRQHSFAIRDMSAACSRCHGSSGAQKGQFGALIMEFETGPHKGPCKSCHTPHGTQGVAKSECFKCHAPIEAKFKAINEKHGACRSCHEPHKPKSAAPARCASCHQAKVTVAAQWPANSAHAKECSQCHQPHDARDKKACADCHAKEATSALGGKHKCTQCHAPHKAPPAGFGAAWWSRCAECHENKVLSVKELGPKHSDCKNCHTPHKFERPTCKSCHKGDEKFAGLHMVKGHDDDCAGCHDPHTKAPPDRSKCAGCHHDRQDHQRSAEKCYGCHVFK